MITKLNIDAIKDGSIPHSKLADSEYFKTFETEEEYITAKESELLDPSCVVYISSEDSFIFPKNDDGSYNAIIEYGNTEVAVFGSAIEQYGYLPISFNPHYYEYFLVDGVDILETNIETLDGEPVLVLYNVNVGDSFEVIFKLKDVIEINSENTYAPYLLYATCSYLEIDESFYNRIEMDSGLYAPIGFYMVSANPDFTCKFIGDFNVAPEYVMHNIQMLLYIQLAMGPSLPDTHFNITLQIPEGNTTYGNPNDLWNEGDSTASFYGACNALLGVMGNPENVSLTIETY